MACCCCVGLPCCYVYTWYSIHYLEKLSIPSCLESRHISGLPRLSGTLSHVRSVCFTLTCVQLLTGPGAYNDGFLIGIIVCEMILSAFGFWQIYKRNVYEFEWLSPAIFHAYFVVLIIWIKAHSTKYRSRPNLNKGLLLSLVSVLGIVIAICVCIFVSSQYQHLVQCCNWLLVSIGWFGLKRWHPGHVQAAVALRSVNISRDSPATPTNPRDKASVTTNPFDNNDTSPSSSDRYNRQKSVWEE